MTDFYLQFDNINSANAPDVLPINMQTFDFSFSFWMKTTGNNESIL